MSKRKSLRILITTQDNVVIKTFRISVDTQVEHWRVILMDTLRPYIHAALLLDTPMKVAHDMDVYTFKDSNLSSFFNWILEI